MIETHEIRYFLAVCQEQNFTRAAQRCRVAQPSLTRAIKKLEEKFGGLLFDRARGRIALTDLGHRVASHLESAMAGIDSARIEASHHKRIRTTALRLGVASAIEPELFEQIFAKLLRDLPSMRIDLREGPVEWIVDALMSDEIDVGLSAGRTYPEFIEAAHVREQYYGVALAIRHPLAHKKEVALAELKNEKIISTAGCDGLHQLMAEMPGNSSGVNAVVMTNSETWAFELTANSSFVTLMPMKPVFDERIVVRPLAGPITRSISLVTMRGRRRIGPAEQFIRLTRRLSTRAEVVAI